MGTNLNSTTTNIEIPKNHNKDLIKMLLNFPKKLVLSFLGIGFFVFFMAIILSDRNTKH